MIDINEITSKITEEKDNLIAKAFTMQIGMLLRENGIFPIATEYTKQDLNNITDAKEYRLVCEYGVAFTELDTSEHDKQVRADERANVIEIIHSFFASELDKLETETDDDFEYFKDTEKANELLSMNKRLCRMIKEKRNDLGKIKQSENTS